MAEILKLDPGARLRLDRDDKAQMDHDGVVFVGQPFRAGYLHRKAAETSDGGGLVHGF